MRDKHRSADEARVAHAQDVKRPAGDQQAAAQVIVSNSKEVLLKQLSVIIYSFMDHEDLRPALCVASFWSKSNCADGAPAYDACLVHSFIAHPECWCANFTSECDHLGMDLGSWNLEVLSQVLRLRLWLCSPFARFIDSK